MPLPQQTAAKTLLLCQRIIQRISCIVRKNKHKKVTFLDSVSAIRILLQDKSMDVIDPSALAIKQKRKLKLTDAERGVALIVCSERDTVDTRKSYLNYTASYGMTHVTDIKARYSNCWSHACLLLTRGFHNKQGSIYKLAV